MSPANTSRAYNKSPLKYHPPSTSPLAPHHFFSRGWTHGPTAVAKARASPPNQPSLTALAYHPTADNPQRFNPRLPRQCCSRCPPKRHSRSPKRQLPTDAERPRRQQPADAPPTPAATGFADPASCCVQ